MMPTVATTGQKLKRLRRGAGLTQTELSEMTGVAQSTIGQIETGERVEPRPATLRKLAQALDVSISDLIED